MTSAGDGGGEEEDNEVGLVENEDYYICKLPDCRAVIQFKKCGARSKILNLYMSEGTDAGLQLTADLRGWLHNCTLCRKELKGAIKSKVWIHIG